MGPYVFGVDSTYTNNESNRINESNDSSSFKDNNSKFIEIIYPKDSQLVRAVDSTFILGNVKIPNVKHILINDKEVRVHKDGGFLGFVPIQPGKFTFKIEIPFQYFMHYSSLVKFWTNITVQIPEPLAQIPFDSLIIAKEIDPPSGYLNLKSGDRLQVSFQGTPGCVASFSISGKPGSIKPRRLRFNTSSPFLIRAFASFSVSGGTGVPLL